MTNKLTISNSTFNPSLSILGKVKFSENGLEFTQGFDSLTSAEHQELWPILLQCNKSSNFWLGDYLAHCEQKTTDPKTGKVKVQMKVKLYEYMEETTGYSRDHLKKLKSVAQRIPIDQRKNLSFRHHADAIGGCGGESAIAFKLLEEAETNQYSLAKFRSEMRTFMAGNPEKSLINQPSDADKDFAETVVLLTKLTTIFNRGNLTTRQKDYITTEIASVITKL